MPCGTEMIARLLGSMYSVQYLKTPLYMLGMKPKVLGKIITEILEETCKAGLQKSNSYNARPCKRQYWIR